MKRRSGRYFAKYSDKPGSAPLWEQESWSRRKYEMGGQSLKDIVETCQMEGVSAKLYDRAGFLKGSCSASGDYRLM